MASKAFSMHIDPKDLKRLHEKLGEHAYLEAMTSVMHSAANLAERHAKQNVPVDTGALRRSINSDAKPLSARVFSNLNYAVPVEVGRKPGQRMPPPNALRGWARRKLGNPNLAFVVARGIAKRGSAKTKGGRYIGGRFFMRKALNEVKKKLPYYMEEAAHYTAEQWGRK
jgi:hypothetical protein|tara:strand:- start:2878 stop:3384 length:507 start_codon:yes stop_codon:yes gene_type:complete